METITQVGKKLVDLETLSPLVPMFDNEAGYQVWLGSVMSHIVGNVSAKSEVWQNAARGNK